MDDERFSKINHAQWAWYAEMIISDRQDKEERDLLMLEYLASFWNHEAVKKIQDNRQKEKEHNFATDDEFEKQLKSQSYKDDDLISTISAIRKNTNLSNTHDGHIDESRFRVPTDLAALKSVIEED